VHPPIGLCRELLMPKKRMPAEGHGSKSSYRRVAAGQRL
jgi:hypothetical protein